MDVQGGVVVWKGESSCWTSREGWLYGRVSHFVGHSERGGGVGGGVGRGVGWLCTCGSVSHLDLWAWLDVDIYEFV